MGRSGSVSDNSAIQALMFLVNRRSGWVRTMTRIRLVSLVFFLAALAFFTSARYVPLRSVSVPTDLTESAAAGTYVLDRDALVQAMLNADSPARQIWERKRNDLLATLELMPPDKAAEERPRAEALIKKLESELRREVERLARSNDIELTLEKEGGFEQKWVSPEVGSWLGRGRWSIRGNELELTYQQMTTPDGKSLPLSKDRQVRMEISRGKLNVRVIDSPSVLTLVRRPPEM
jgi:hypothetical protein